MNISELRKKTCLKPSWNVSKPCYDLATTNQKPAKAILKPFYTFFIYILQNSFLTVRLSYLVVLHHWFLYITISHSSNSTPSYKACLCHNTVQKHVVVSAIRSQMAAAPSHAVRINPPVVATAVRAMLWNL